MTNLKDKFPEAQTWCDRCFRDIHPKQLKKWDLKSFKDPLMVCKRCHYTLNEARKAPWSIE